MCPTVPTAARRAFVSRESAYLRGRCPAPYTGAGPHGPGTVPAARVATEGFLTATDVATAQCRSLAGKSVPVGRFLNKSYVMKSALEKDKYIFFLECLK